MTVAVLHPDASELRFATLLRKRRETLLVNAGSFPFADDSIKLHSAGPQMVRPAEAAEVFVQAAARSGARRLVLVLPDAWMRSFVLEGEAMPHREKELRERVAWHLKKAFLLKPDEVRFAWARLRDGAGGVGRLLVTFTLDRFLSTLDEAFDHRKLRLGAVVTSFWTLYHALPRQGDWGLLVVEEGLWTLGAFTDGHLLSLRQRLLPPGGPGPVMDEVRRTFALGGAAPPSRLVVYQHPAVLPLEEGGLPGEVLAPALRGRVRADASRLPQFWNPEGEIFAGGLHVVP
jgi:hypothetical protein